MRKVFVVSEGRTETTIIRSLIAGPLAIAGVAVIGLNVPTSKRGRGGALSWDRVRPFILDRLSGPSDAYVTTMFDLYRLHQGFPGYQAGLANADPIARADQLEFEFQAAIVNEAGCRPERFLPHIQPHELEALLLSDVSAFSTLGFGWDASVERLREARELAPTPEHINHGPLTHPSARLAVLRDPRYRKVLHGNLIARSIGLDRIRAECAHFGRWLDRLEALPEPDG